MPKKYWPAAVVVGITPATLPIEVFWVVAGMPLAATPPPMTRSSASPMMLLVERTSV